MTAGADDPGTLIRNIEPFDALEAQHRRDALAWIGSGAPLYRARKPATPAKHLVSYFVPVDVPGRRLMLIDHRRSGLLLPPGGHVEPGEPAVLAAERECREELGIAPSWESPTQRRPLFVTVTQTRPSARQVVHTDVSLWFVLSLLPETELILDEREIAAVHWLDFAAVRRADTATLDPHLPRFVSKLEAALN